MGKMDTVLGIPGAHTAKAVAAMVQCFQYLGNLSGGFLLFKGCSHTLPLTLCIAAQPQHMVEIPLRNRKGRGCLCILCLVNSSDLLLFAGKQA